jgi:hypothetical protein
LPLAHEQVAAYCDRLDVSLAEYQKRFEAASARLLDTPKDAPDEYHGGLTVAKTFALAIDEASKLHPAAEPLIVHAAPHGSLSCARSLRPWRRSIRARSSTIQKAGHGRGGSMPWPLRWLVALLPCVAEAFSTISPLLRALFAAPGTVPLTSDSPFIQTFLNSPRREASAEKALAV